MPIALKSFSYNIELYKTIKEILVKPIDTLKLPIVGESKVFKMSAERYGHVILKIDLETDKNMIHSNGFSYAWEMDEKFKVLEDEKFPSNTILPISKEYYEAEILNEIFIFTNLFRFLNEDKTPLRFSVIGGSYKINERSYFYRATGEAIVQIFKKLQDETVNPSWGILKPLAYVLSTPIKIKKL
jgi:hypothetical protein